MSTRLIVVAVTAVAIALAGGLIAANLAGGSTAPPSLERLSNLGATRVSPLPGDEQALSKTGGAGADIRVLATRGGRSLYRVGTDCYGVGPNSGTDYRFGQLSCDPAFPSKDHPVLDFTVFRGKLVNGRIASHVVWRSEGFAADGVTSIGFRNDAGEIVGETPVGGNTYSHSSIPLGSLRALVALDASGAVVDTHPLP